MVTAEEGRLAVEWAGPTHFEPLEALFAACYPQEGWRAEDFADFLDRHQAGNVVKVLLAEGGLVAGGLLYSVGPRAVRLRRVAVWPRRRRRGLGGHLVGHLTGPRSPVRRPLTLARVPQTDLPAQLFLRSLGFAADVRRSGLDGAGRPYYLFEHRKPVRLTGRIL